MQNTRSRFRGWSNNSGFGETRLFNNFATAFGSFGASVSHADLAVQSCTGEQKNTVNEYLSTIVNAYQQAARATYLSSGLHYKHCAKTNKAKKLEINAEILEEIREIEELELLEELI